MNTEVAIVGGGLVGGSLAVALADAGLNVTLIDPVADRGNAVPKSDSGQPDAQFDTRVFALRPGSRDFLAKCGVWCHIDESRVAPVYKMAITGDDGDSRLTFDAYRCGVLELALIVENGNLQKAIQHALDERTSVRQARGRMCVAATWQAGEVTISLDDGEAISPELVVAADGANSRLRGFAGIGSRQSGYNQCAVVANFATSVAHDGTAYQWFRTDGVLALLPLPGNRVSMVWSTADEHARELVALDPAELAARVSRASTTVLGELTTAGQAAAFPLRLMRAASIVGPRLALVGDAAHNVHPLAGQGLNLGLADAQSLAETIARRGPDGIGSRAVLAKYRRSRAEETAAMQFTTDGLYRLFDSSAPGLPWLRNAGLRLTEQLTPFKRLLVKRAAG
jgi:ubiquinone biosynthesis UbiH/UbiF/VisC/COQ6 family hydroxylase